MSELLDTLFSGATLPGTILLGVCIAYWLLLIAGAVDPNVLDFDLGADVEPDVGGTSWGMTAFKFLNVNDVPLMIWMSIFAASYVVSSAVLAGYRDPGNEIRAIAAAVACSGVIALVATKLLTQPLRGKFDTIEPNVAQTLVGRICVITTSEVSDRFGQARVEADGAPLLLNIRGPADSLTKDDAAVITGYDPYRAVFFVEPVSVAPHEPPQRETVS